MLVYLAVMLTKVYAAVDADLLKLVTKTNDVTITSLTNDETYPWEKQDDGTFKRYGSVQYKTSSITLEFTCKNKIYVDLNYVFSKYSNWEKFNFQIDDVTILSTNTATDNGTMPYVCEAGSHKVIISLYNDYTVNTSICATLKSINLENLESKYTTINLSAPGTLGSEILSRYSTLPVVKFLKLSGAINSDDWAKISQMTGLVSLDMENVQTTEIPASTFKGGVFRNYVFPKTLKSIGSNAFNGRPLLGTVSLPKGLETIGAGAFNSTTLSGCEMQSTVKTIGEYAFYNCNSLTKVTGTDNVQTIAHEAFRGCTQLKSFDFSNVKTIDYWAFYDCYALQEVNAPMLSSLGSCAFRYCKALTKVTLSDYLAFIPDNSFYSCDELQTVTLGASTTNFSHSAFTNSPKITKIYCNAPAPPSIYNADNLPFDAAIPTKAVLYIPEYAITSYKLDSYWSKFLNVEKNTNATSGLSLSRELRLISGVRIPGSPNIIINYEGKLSVDGSAEQKIGDFVAYFQNDNAKSATLISRCANLSSQSSEVRYNMTTGYWYFICMPFDVAVSSITATNGASIAIRYYDGAGRANGNPNNWVEPASSSILKAGQGYIFYVSANSVVNFPATAATHNYIFASSSKVSSLNAYPTSTSADANWNLVGNPYPAYYDIYHMDFTSPITVWNVNNRTYTAYSAADDNLVLLPLQAFFVQKTDAANTITFNSLGRQNNTTIERVTASSAKRMSAGMNNRSIINLALSNGETEDVTRVVVNPMASDEYDMENDAAKMFSMETTPQLYTIADNVMYSINEGVQASGKVKIGMWMPKTGSYTISAPRADVDIKILDNGTAVTLPYTFDAVEGTDDERFVMLINNTTTGIEEYKSADENNTTVFDLSGRRVTDSNRKGIYIINNKKVVK